MNDSAIFLLSLAGFAALLAARHGREWFGHALSRSLSRSLRLAGFLSLVLAFAAAIIGLGWAVGAVAWFGWMTVAAALAVVATLCREHILRSHRP
ncbi:MAG: DUF3325 family protein [Phenylobacterium sp.]